MLLLSTHYQAAVHGGVVSNAGRSAVGRGVFIPLARHSCLYRCCDTHPTSCSEVYEVLHILAHPCQGSCHGLARSQACAAMFPSFVAPPLSHPTPFHVSSYVHCLSILAAHRALRGCFRLSCRFFRWGLYDGCCSSSIGSRLAGRM